MIENDQNESCWSSKPSSGTQIDKQTDMMSHKINKITEESELRLQTGEVKIDRQERETLEWINLAQ